MSKFPLWSRFGKRNYRFTSIEKRTGHLFVKIYRLMSEGVPVPNNIIDDLIAEAMVAAAEKSKVKPLSPARCTPSLSFEPKVGAASALLAFPPSCDNKSNCFKKLGTRANNYAMMSLIKSLLPSVPSNHITYSYRHQHHSVVPFTRHE